MAPVHAADIPNSNAITYGTMVCDPRPLKTETHHCRLVVGADKLKYDNETAAPAANLLETKIMINSVISTNKAKFLTVDIKDFFVVSHVETRIYETPHWRHSRRYRKQI